MFEAAGAIGMYQWMQAMSLRTCIIARHLELRERFDDKAISELKEELLKLRKAHAGEIRSLEEKFKKAKSKC